jgi:hypothetical protein
MGRRYILDGENMTLGTGNVLAAIQSAAAGSAGAILEIERVEISQSGTATAAQIRVAMGTRNTAGTLTMTSATPAPLVLGGPASGIAGNTAPAGGTARCGVNSSADSGGTYTDTYFLSPNNLGGMVWIPTPQTTLIVPPSTLFVVRLLATPGTSTGYTVSVWYHEIF